MIRSPRLPRRAVIAAALSLLAASLLASGPLASSPALAQPAGGAAESAYAFSLPGIDGAPLDLAAYRGKAMLVVNTASLCGFTDQYEGLQKIWDQYRDQGLVVIGAPSGDFRQELSDASKVKEFCDATFGITFPMTDIISVRGQNAHPFFVWLSEQSEKPEWNFNKYLIGRDGSVLRHYDASETPETLTPDLEAALAMP